MLLPYRVKVSDTKVTHFTPILALCPFYIDHIYRKIDRVWPYELSFVDSY